MLSWKSADKWERQPTREAIPLPLAAVCAFEQALAADRAERHLDYLLHFCSWSTPACAGQTHRECGWQASRPTATRFAAGPGGVRPPRPAWPGAACAAASSLLEALCF